MKIRDYRIYYFDKEEKIDEMINLIKETTAKKLGLVVHSDHPIFDKESKLKLLREVAVNWNKNLVFINPDSRIKKTLKKVGFKVFRDLEDLEKNISSRNKEDQTNEVVDNKRKSHILFTIASIFIVLGLAWFYFMYPATTVDIKPVTEYARKDITLKASLDRTEINWEDQILPLHKFEVTLTDEDQVETSGQKLIGTTSAVGVVKFINELKKEVAIPKGTQLKTSNGLLFETVKKTVVPKLKVDYLMNVAVGMKAGQTEAEIRALKKGSRGNVSTGKISSLVNPIKGIHVINPEPTRNGQDKHLAVVTQEDIDKVKANLKEKIKNKLLTKIYQKLGGNYRVIDKQIEYSKINFKYNHQAGDVSNQLKGTGTLVARGYLVRNNELDQLVTKIYRDNLDKNYTLVGNGINISEIKLAENQEGLYNIKLESVAPVIPKIVVKDVRKKLAGMKLQEAKEYLQGQKNIQSYKINNNKEYLPRFSFAIDVEVTKPDDSYQVFDVKNNTN